MKAAVRMPQPISEGLESSSGVDLLTRLEGICARRGPRQLAPKLAALAELVGPDIAQLEQELATLPQPERLVGHSAHHLLDLGGKRLRPMCVALAARVGDGFSPQVLDLAVAVELVHSATLLHDDVVDLGETRRGKPSSRAVYGNAASIFAGDWLLIEALRRVERAALPRLTVSLFDTIEEMIFAESLQLENRGRISLDREVYFQVVEGKTASVFRWAMTAGATAGRLSDAQRRTLESYGLHLGVAFQATDDLLDLTGDADTTGKELFADLREGKMTYPLIVALERDPALGQVVEEILAEPAEQGVSRAAAARVMACLAETRAVEDCRQLAQERCALAVECLAPLPEGPAKWSLATIAESLVDRDL